MKPIKIKVKDYYTNEMFKILRNALDLKQKDVAQIIGKNKSSIEKYEYGTSSYSFASLLKFVRACNLEIIIKNNEMKINASEYKTNELLKLLRTKLNLTQKEMAQIVNRNKSSIEKYEYGIMDYSFEILVELAKKKNLEIIITSKTD